ncbi:MAG: O-antigen ligase family protein [Kiritimatiellia bacterium]|jgi:hypothetical protein|nr:O-antigen ligase family protein [Kiritimatiellia bacterium]
MTFSLSLIFMFLVFWRPQDWLIPQLQGWPILDAVVLLALMTLLVEVDGKQLRMPKKSPQVWLFIGLWIATLFSHLANTYWGGFTDTLEKSFKFSLFGILLITATDRSDRLRRVAFLFVGMALFMTLHGWLQVKRGYGFGHYQPLVHLRPLTGETVCRSRFYGIFGDPNDLAQVLAVAIPFTFVLFRRINAFSILKSCALSGLLVAGMMTTHSRGGLVALTVAVPLTISAFMRPIWQKLALCGLGIGWLLMLPLSGRLMDASASDRVIFWGAANDAFKARPLFGVGYGLIWEYTDDRAVHNAFLTCSAELGFFGYWHWFGLIVASFLGLMYVSRTLKTRKDGETRYLRVYAGMVRASLGAYLASSFFLSRAYAWPFFFLVGIAAALPLVVSRTQMEDAWIPEYEASRFLVRNTVASLGSVLYIYACIRLIHAFS